MPTVEFTFCAYTSRGESFSEVSVRTEFTVSVWRSPTYTVVAEVSVLLSRSRIVAPTPRQPPSSEHASAMEQTAALAERASIKYKEVEFLQDRIGQEFDGTISGVTEYGLYVEINENKCEGMIPLRDLDDDYYEFDEKQYCLWGRRTHKRYSLGDEVRISIASANLDRKQLNFALVSE